jgi:magnesium-transporting ATPase (P-type)
VSLQLLWVNLIMDTMGALALATEDPNPDLLNDKVCSFRQSIVGTSGVDTRRSLCMIALSILLAHAAAGLHLWGCWVTVPAYRSKAQHCSDLACHPAFAGMWGLCAGLQLHAEQKQGSIV